MESKEENARQVFRLGPLAKVLNELFALSCCFSSLNP